MGSCSESRREMRVAWRSGVEGTWLPTVHATCPHNEIAALCMRSLAPLPEPVFRPVRSGARLVFRDLANIARRYSGYKWGYLETAQTYDGAMRRRYVEAANSLIVDGRIGWNDVYLRCFLKAEKLNALAKFPKPRLIFPRSPRYNLVLASRLKPFEHWLWGYLTAQKLFHGSNTRVVAKGLSPRQRANLIVRKFTSLDECVVFEVDGKAFEAHVGPHQLKLEHAVYAAAYPRDGKLRKMLREQLVLRGVLPSGAKFSREGGRASGDFNTGMGNSLIMLAVVVGVLRDYNVPFDVMVDGDNALVFLRGRDSSRVLRTFASDVLNCSGHEVQLERPVNIIEEIRFGRSAPVNLGPYGWCMCRDWRSVLSNALCSHKWLKEPRFAIEWLTGVAMCELSLARGVPVVQQWALSILRSTGFTKRVRAHPFTDYFVVGGWLAGEEAAQPVSSVARDSYHRAFGLSPEAQIGMENGFGGVLPQVYSRHEPPIDNYADPGLAETWLDSLV